MHLETSAPHRPATAPASARARVAIRIAVAFVVAEIALTTFDHRDHATSSTGAGEARSAIEPGADDAAWSARFYAFGA